MAVKKRTSRANSRSKKIDFMKAVSGLGEPASLIGGVVIGKKLIAKLTKSQAVSGLLGVETSKYLVPVTVAVGGMAIRQMISNPFAKTLMIGVSGAGVEKTIEVATGKTLLGTLGGLLGDSDEYDYNQIASLNPNVQMLPPADIDIEQEIEDSVSGVYEDMSMNDEPVGETDSDDIDNSVEDAFEDSVSGVYEDMSMNDEPVGEADIIEEEMNDDIY